ncbi:hypothetical protein DFA_08087 [Cavenderia fasciculata]|uniref:Ankyrin repeat-containing protein n=1 Tax=Cavenderia fasciculata TaxID=261658 RepID=F4Q4Z9_CACFS|nr:uncharacterized protein DFA_08087 [Cavenderia fasciculata]EGG17105.1 hypothetical protein DFA_08087 [Cavenderia fasciculata]|eukprot:XP_004355589.1 hypothetical protein DFA_08087 [Cavenderia fasciculata]
MNMSIGIPSHEEIKQRLFEKRKQMRLLDKAIRMNIDESFKSILTNKYIRKRIIQYVQTINKLYNHGISIPYNTVDTFEWLVDQYFNKKASASLLVYKIQKNIGHIRLPTFVGFQMMVNLDLCLYKQIYLHFQDRLLEYPYLMDSAANKGRSDIVDFLIDKRAPFTSHAIENACCNGYIGIADKLLNCDYIKPEWMPSTRGYDGAAQNGHLDVLKYLDHSSRIVQPIETTTQCIDQACKNNREDVVRYLMETRTEGFTRHAIIRTVECGNLPLYHHLRQNMASLSHNHFDSSEILGAVIIAAENGHVEMVKHMFGTIVQQKDLEYPIDTHKLRQAVVRASPDPRILLEYMIKNGVLTEYSLVEDDDLIAVASKYCGLGMVKYLVNINRNRRIRQNILIQVCDQQPCALDVIEYLFQECQEPRRNPENSYRTVIMSVIRYDNIELFQLMQRYPPMLDVATNVTDDYTMQTAISGKYRIVELLLDHFKNDEIRFNAIVSKMAYSPVTELAKRMVTDHRLKPSLIALRTAVIKNNTELLQFYIDTMQNNPESHEKIDNYIVSTLLCDAAERDRVAVVKLLHEKFGIRQLKPVALDGIAYRGRVDLMDFLLSNTKQDAVKVTSSTLLEAVKSSRLDMFFQNAKGRSTVPKNYFGGAASQGNLGIIRQLQHLVPDIQEYDSFLITSLLVAKTDVPMLTLFQNNINYTDVLRQCCKHENLTFLKTYLLDKPEFNHRAILLEAIQTKNLDIVKTIVAAVPPRSILAVHEQRSKWETPTIEKYLSLHKSAK